MHVSTGDLGLACVQLFTTSQALVNQRVQCNAAEQGVLEARRHSPQITTHLATSPLEVVQRLAAL